MDASPTVLLMPTRTRISLLMTMMGLIVTLIQERCIVHGKITRKRNSVVILRSDEVRQITSLYRDHAPVSPKTDIWEGHWGLWMLAP